MNKMKKKSRIREKILFSRWTDLRRRWKYLLLLVGALLGIAGSYVELLAEKYLSYRIFQLLTCCIIVVAVGLFAAAWRKGQKEQCDEADE